MTGILDVFTVGLIVAGCFFFTAGTIGLLRLPDLFSRLHAVTKADTLGLGLVVAGLALQASSVQVVAKLILVWLLAMLSATTAGQLIAGRARSDLALDHLEGGAAPAREEP